MNFCPCTVIQHIIQHWTTIIRDDNFARACFPETKIIIAKTRQKCLKNETNKFEEECLDILVYQSNSRKIRKSFFDHFRSSMSDVFVHVLFIVIFMIHFCSAKFSLEFHYRMILSQINIQGAGRCG